MRQNRDRNYEDYNYREDQDDTYNRYNQDNNQRYQSRDRYQEQGQQYGRQQYPGSSRGGNEQGSHDDYYNQMYDISNYSGIPRADDYGLPHGTESELQSIKPMPLQQGPYYGRQRFNYTLGYNPNFDNPEEGDMYRNFDSRGNHGYRHDASYGNQDEFRDFGNDRYGDYDRTYRRYNQNDDYNRY